MRTYMREFAQFHWNVSRGIKTMTLSDSIQSTTCTLGQWCCDAACFLTQLFILMFAEILLAVRLLWQEDYYGALLLLLCVEGASSTGLPNRTADQGITIRLLVHLQLTHNTEPSVILKWPTVCTSVHLQEMELNVLSRCAIIKRLVIIFRPQFTFPPLWLNCW